MKRRGFFKSVIACLCAPFVVADPIVKAGGRVKLSGTGRPWKNYTLQYTGMSKEAAMEKWHAAVKKSKFKPPHKECVVFGLGDKAKIVRIK